MKTTMLLLSVAAIALAGPGATQKVTSNAVDNAPPITVQGIPDGPENRGATSNPRIPGRFQIESSSAFGRSTIFVRCAKPDAAALHAIIEGPPNLADTVVRQGLYTQQHAGCHLSGGGVHDLPADYVRGTARSNPSAFSGNEAWLDLPLLPPVPQGFYDRGALIEYAIRNYAADVEVTKADTHNEQVVNRFIAVEQGRNRYRWPEDLAYFKIAACMVQAQPELAGRLAVATHGSADAGRLADAIIAKAHLCVPNARHIEVDPTQFRIYVMDAYYRWAEATRGVDALIPDA